MQGKDCPTEIVSATSESVWYCCECEDGPFSFWNPVCPVCGHHFRKTHASQHQPTSIEAFPSVPGCRPRPFRSATAWIPKDFGAHHNLGSDQLTVDPKDIFLPRTSDITNQSNSLVCKDAPSSKKISEQSTSSPDPHYDDPCPRPAQREQSCGTSKVPQLETISSVSQNQVPPNVSESLGAHQPKDPTPTQLACPFYKHKPHLCRSRACNGRGWGNIHHLREHLSRVHLYYQCPHCSSPFHTLDRLQSHRKQPCSRRSPRNIYGISAEKWATMPPRIRRGSSKEKQWRSLFTTFFPNVRDIPSPTCKNTDEDIFVDDDDLEPPYHHRLLDEYEEYLLHHLPRQLHERLQEDRDTKVDISQVIISSITDAACTRYLHDAIRGCTNELRKSLPEKQPVPATTENLNDVDQSLQKSDQWQSLMDGSSTPSELDEDWNLGSGFSSTGQSKQGWQSIGDSTQFPDTRSAQQMLFYTDPYRVDSASFVDPLLWRPPCSPSAQFQESSHSFEAKSPELSSINPIQPIPRNNPFGFEEADRMLSALPLEGPPNSFDDDQIDMQPYAKTFDNQILQPLFEVRPNEWDANIES